MAQALTHRTDTSDMLIPHGVFRRVLADAYVILDGVSEGDTEHGAAVRSYFDNVLRFLDAHHDGEDVIVWPALTERCPEAKWLIADMQTDHAAIHGLRERAGSRLDLWGESLDRGAGRALAVSFASLLAELEAHLTREEAEILPLASANMSPEEWGELPGHAMRNFTGDKIWLIIGLILEPMSEREKDGLLALLPPPVVEMWTTTGSAAYDDFMALVRKYR